MNGLNNVFIRYTYVLTPVGDNGIAPLDNGIAVFILRLCTDVLIRFVQLQR